MSFLRTLPLLSVLLVTLTPDLSAEDTPKKGKKEKPPTYAVVQHGDAMTVMQSSEVKDAKKRAADEYEAAVKAHKEAKKAAKKAKEKFTEPAPEKRSFKVLKDKLKSEEDARAYIASREASASKKGKKGKGGGGR